MAKRRPMAPRVPAIPPARLIFELLDNTESARLPTVNAPAAVQRALGKPLLGFSIDDIAASSAVLPIIPNRRTTRSSCGGRTVISKSEASPAMPDATDRIGSILRDRCHSGIAVAARSTPVYP